jgi:hypothetical protein
VIGHSTVVADNCVMKNATAIAVLLDGGSSVAFNLCTVRDTARLCVGIVARSIFIAHDSTFSHSTGNCITADAAASISLTHCTFSHSAAQALCVGHTPSVVLDRCQFRECVGGALTFITCESVHITNCKFRDLGQTAIFMDNSAVSLVETTIHNTEGNGMNASHRSRLTATRVFVSNTKFPSVAVCDDSTGLISHCRLVDTRLNGVVVRMNSTAHFTDCWIAGSPQHAVCVSDSRRVTFRRCFIGDAQFSVLSVYNSSVVVATDCVFAGPSAIGIDVFTGAAVDAARCIVAGMTNHFLRIHHGGAGRFAKLVLSSSLGSPECVVRSVRFDGASAVTPERAVAAEGDKEVVVLGSSLGGPARFDFVRNAGVRPQPPVRPRSPMCESCGGDAGSCFFAPCGHAVMCRACWDTRAERPSLCPLCMVEITRVLAPVDCSPDHDAPTCPICAENEVSGFTVPCGHTICSACARMWFDTHSICPYCRAAHARFREFIWHS